MNHMKTFSIAWKFVIVSPPHTTDVSEGKAVHSTYATADSRDVIMACVYRFSPKTTYVHPATTYYCVADYSLSTVG